MPPNTIYVGRPTRWGNPIYAGLFRDYTVEDAVRDYRAWLEREPAFKSFDHRFGKPPALAEIRAKLKGKNLCCWCKPDAPCHADVLLDIANNPKGAAPARESKGDRRGSGTS